MLRFTTAGESHGQALVSLLEGVPAGLPLLAEHVDHELARRQQGYGRGRRMQIERDHVELVAGVRAGETIQSLASRMAYRDFKLERFLSLNGLAANSALVPGQKVKLVVYGTRRT